MIQFVWARVRASRYLRASRSLTQCEPQKPEPSIQACSSSPIPIACAHASASAVGVSTGVSAPLDRLVRRTRGPAPRTRSAARNLSVAALVLASQQVFALGVVFTNTNTVVYAPNGLAAPAGGSVSAGMTANATVTPPGSAFAVKTMELREVVGSSYASRGTFTCTLKYDDAGKLLDAPCTASMVTPLAAGTHELYMHAATPTMTADSTHVMVTITANHAPTISLTSPPDGARVMTASGSTSLPVVAAGADADGNLSGVSVSVDGTATLSGASSVNSPVNLSVGHHTITAISTDSMGATATSSVGVDVYADAAPTASLTVPANGARFLTVGSNSVVAVQGTGSDPDVSGLGGEFDHLTLTVDGALNTTSSTTSLSTSVVATIGNHTLVLTAYDKMGRTATSTSTITVAADTAPTVSVQSPANNARILTAGSTGTVSIVASGADADGNLASVTASIDGGATTLSGASSINSPVSLAVGHHTMTVTSQDTNGAVSTPSTTIAFDVVADAAPIAAVQTPPNGSTYLAHDSGSTFALPFQGTGTDADAAGSGGELDHVSMTVDGVASGSTTNWLLSTTLNLAPGAHTIVFTATDKLGRTSSVTTSVTITADSAPTVSITSPANGAKVLTAGTTGSFTLIAAGADADANLSSISASIDGAAPSLTGASSINSAINLAVGHHSIAVTATDALGVTGTSTIGVDVVADAAPTVTLLTPANGAQVLAPGATVAVAVQGTGADTDAAGSGGEFDHLSLTVDGVANATSTNGSLTTSLNLAPGAHTIVLTSTDKLGRTASATSSITVVADRAPAGSMTSPTDGQVIITYSGTPATVPVVGTMTDPDTALGDSVARTEIWMDGASMKSVTGGAVNTSFTTGISGAHSLKLHAFDAAGLAGDSTALNFTVRVVGPMVGNVDGITYDTTGLPIVSGWACDRGITTSVSVAVYAGGPAGTGTLIGTITANSASEAAIATSCGTTGTAYRWSMSLGSAQAALGGQAIYAYGVSAQNGGAQTLLTNSGSFSLPAVGTPIPVTIAPPLLSQPDAGTLPGSLSVSDGGMAAYSIPIEAPPGSGGMTPSLALSYLSEGPNGVLGVGWTLNGLSSIRRCAKTIAQDGTPGRIRFDNGDRLCLDGERLMRVNGTGQDDASYWAVNGEYRTEVESFARVTALSTGFKVERKDGHIEYYGTQSTAIQTVGLPSVSTLFWPLSRVEDRSGNYLTVSYLDEGQGEYGPSQISYGGNTNNATAPDLAVRLVYESRPDAQVRYSGGSRNDLRYRLSHVQTFTGVATDGTGGTKVRDYTLTYIQSSSSNRSMLSGIQACGTNPVTSVTECLPKTSFEWGQQAAWSQASVPFSLGTITTRPSVPLGQGARGQRLQANLDGSGMPSYVIAQTVSKCDYCEPIDEATYYDVLTGTLSVTPSSGGPATTYTLSFGTTFPEKIIGFEFGDFNGDGLDDVVLERGTHIAAICMNNGTTTLSCQNWVDPAGVTLTFSAPMDLYNDRRMHFRQGPADVWLGTDNQWHSQTVSVVDVTQGGLPTVFGVPSKSEPIGFSEQDVSDFYYVYPPSGLTNEVPGGLRACIESTVATGLQYTCQTLIASAVGNGGSETSGDLNGDGLTDFLFGMQGGNYMVCLSTEVGVKCTDSGVPTANSGKAYIGDFLGDGSTGVFFAASSAGTPKYCHLDVNLTLQCKPLLYPDTTGPYASDVQPVDLSRIPSWLFVDKNANVGAGMEAVRPYTLKAPASQDRVTAAVNGVGYRQEVDYSRSDDSATVRRLTQASGVDQPLVYPLVSRPVSAAVKQIRSSNGQGGWLSTNYHYEGAATHAQGRGDAGFGLTAHTDTLSGVTTTQKLHQDYPFIGSAAHATTVSRANTTLNDASFTYVSKNVTALAGGSFTIEPDLKVTTSVQQDLDGSSLGTTTVTDTYGDAWGNVTQHQTVRTLGANTYTSTVDTLYQNTTSPWIAGLPLTVTTTSAGPDGVLSAARVMSNTYDATTGAIKTQQQAPNDAAFNWTNTYDRTGNVYGLVNKITQSWIDPYTGTAALRLTRDVDFDSKGRFILTSRNALGQAVHSTWYASVGAPATSVDLNSLTTTFKVNAFGRLTSKTAPDSNETRHYVKQCDSSCPANAVLASIEDSFNGASRTRTPSIEYADSHGATVQRSTWAYDGTAVVTSTRFDSAGRIYEVDQPRFASAPAYLQERRLYDDLGRVTTLTTKKSDGTEVSATTLYAGPVTTLTNAKGQVRIQTNDALGHLVQVVNKTDAGDVVTKLAYDSFGSLSQTVDPNGNVQTVSYDKYGHRTDLRDPDLGWVHYDVDPVGRTWRRVKPNERAAGTSTRYQLDALDRMTDQYQSDQQDHWIFDTAAHGIGALAEEYTGPSTAKDYRRLVAYDSLSRASSSTTVLDTVSYVSSMSFDPWGRLLSTSEQHGTDAAKAFTRMYNAQGYLSRVSHGGTVLWTLNNEDAAGRALTATLGNGLVQVDHYDPYTAGFDDTLVRVGAAGTQRFHEHLTFDTLGSALTRAGQYNYGQGDASAYSDTLGYDKLNRLTSFQEWSNTAQSFGYDAGGNLLSKMDPTASPALAATYTYPAQGAASVRPHAVQSITGWTGTFSYDADGNQLSSPAGLASTWNSFDMPIRVERTSGGTTRFDQFVYGPTHDRAKMNSGTGSTVSKITYFAGAQEVETDGSGNVTTVKTYWPMKLGVDIDAPATATRMLWLHRDRLGSVLASTDSSGALVERLNYDAWGNRRYLNGIGISSAIVDATNNRGFTGQLMLDDIGLVHYNGRLYDPLIGRFISADPVIARPDDGQDYSRYTYVSNNPTNLTDPSGFTEQTPPPTPPKKPKDPHCDQWCWANGGISSDYYKLLVANASEAKKKDAASSQAVCNGMCHGYDGTPGRPMTPEEEAKLQIATAILTAPIGGAELEGLNLARGSVALDTNALVAILERGNTSILSGGERAFVSITAAKEFLAGGGSADALRQLLISNGGRIISGTEDLAASLRVQAAALGRSLRVPDSRVAAAAIENKLTLITQDSKLTRFLQAIGVPVRGF